MVHSLSCTDTEWERVRERADAAGLSMSRYLVERALTVELPRDGDGKIGPPPRLVLSEGEQQHIRERIERIYARMSTGSAEEDRSVLARLNSSVSLLTKAAMLDLVRGGRTRQMIALLAEQYGEEKAVRRRALRGLGTQERADRLTREHRDGESGRLPVPPAAPAANSRPRQKGCHIEIPGSCRGAAPAFLLGALALDAFPSPRAPPAWSGRAAATRRASAEDPGSP